MTQDFFNLGLVRRDRASEARFISLQRVRGYWEALIGPGGTLPGPAALDPRGLLPALEDVFLAERIGEGLLRLRIAGRRVSAPAGMDMQGLPLSALFLPEARPALAHTVERVCQHHSLVTMEMVAEGGLGRTALSARMLLLPLEAPVRGMPAILGCLSTLGEVGRTPRRFAVASVVEERLGQRLADPAAAMSDRAGLPQNQAEGAASDPPAGETGFAFAEEPAPFSGLFTAAPAPGDKAGSDTEAATEVGPSGRPGNTSGRPKLRLVHSQD